MTSKSLKNIVVLFFPLLVIISCKESYIDDEKTNQKPYSISLAESSSLVEVEKLKSKLENKFNGELRIEKLKEKKYKLLYGHFSSSYEAGKKAYDFYSDSLITNYKIIRNGKPVFDSFTNILFIGQYLGRPSVFSFNLLTKQNTIEWSRWHRKVITLNSSNDNRTAFIVTALSHGRVSGFPYIHESRVYQLNLEEDQTNELAELGDGVQLYTLWDNDNFFKVNFTMIDTLNSKIVEQNIYSFDITGKKSAVEKRKFDLLKYGFPLPPKRKPIYNSPNKRFQFRSVFSGGETDIYVKDFEEHSEVLIVSSDKIIYDARWSENGNYIFLIMNNSEIKLKSTKPITDELIIIDAVHKKIIKIFTGYRFENLLVHGKLLFFDERLGNIAQIAVYDYIKDKLIFTISSYGGCGLNNLPM